MRNAFQNCLLQNVRRAYGNDFHWRMHKTSYLRAIHFIWSSFKSILLFFSFLSFLSFFRIRFFFPKFSSIEMSIACAEYIYVMFDERTWGERMIKAEEHCEI